MSTPRRPEDNAGAESTVQVGDGGAPAAWVDPALPVVDARPDDRYEVGGEVARGGLGRIRRAWDRRLNRPVAVKELLRNQPGAEARFLREARITASLEHPAIIPVHDAGRWSTGEPFYAMKLVAGESLAEVLARTTSLAERLALLPHVFAVAEAVAYAHSLRVIHRDLKPGNVLLGPFGETVVIDWGLAKDLAAGPERAEPGEHASTPPSGDGLTAHGAVMGTPAYMAPEQAAGASVDARADVYALGAILYHLLAGASPYAHVVTGGSTAGGDGSSVLEQLRAGPPPPVEELQPDVPRDLRAIVAKAMARAPGDRYPSARELAEDLRRFQTGQIVGAHHYSLGEIVGRWLRRHRTTVAVASVLFLALIVVGVVSVREIWARGRRAELQRERAESERREATHRSAEALREGARGARARGDTLEARAKLRGSLEAEDSALARATWLALTEDPLRWKQDVGAAVYNVAFSPDGATVAAACQDRSVYLFDVTTKAVRVLRGQGDQVTALAFAPDGKTLATGAWNGEVGVWDLATGGLRRLRGHTAATWALAYSPDGTRLVSGSIDNTIRIWNVATGATERVLTGHTAEVTRVVVSGDGATLLSVSSDRTARLWSFPAGELRQTLRGHALSLTGGDISPDGTRVATASLDRTVMIWDAATGAVLQTLAGHREQVQTVRFAPDGKHLASAGADRSIRIWDLATGATITELLGHTDRITDVDISPDGTMLVSGGNDDGVRLWDLGRAGGPAPHGHALPVVGVAFSPDSARVSSASYDQTARVWNVATGAQELVLAGHTQRVYTAKFTPDGAQLATASGDQSVRLWDARSGALTKRLEHGAAVYDLAIRPDGKVLASAGTDDIVRLWALPAGTAVGALTGHTDRIYAVAWSPDGKTLATGSYDTTIRVWDAATARTTRVLRGHTAAVDGLAFTPDGKTLVSGSEDATVRAWDLATGAGRVVGTHPSRVYRIAMHPDGLRVGASGADGTARIWELATGRFVELAGHRGEVDDFAFSPDGRWAATSSDDGTVRLWDAATGHLGWRAPALLAASGEVLTHAGWHVLPGGHAITGPIPAWRRAIETARHADRGDGDALCLWTWDGEVALWSVAQDRQLAATAAPGVRAVFATPTACAIVGAGGAQLLGTTGARVLDGDATAATWSGDELLIATSTQVLRFDATGARTGALPGRRDVTAVGRIGDAIVLGFDNGNLERLTAGATATLAPEIAFEETPANPVVRIVPGPLGTVIAGYADGLLGIWQLDNGVRLYAARLHGAVQHLARAGGRLLVATELGDVTAIDLSAFSLDYCELVRRVWDAVPVAWEGGLVVRRALPRDHACARP
ncbi:MAG: protein kinase [Deltaproteobacteria bacterium]|nr:protein kinase [Deltaproteobacteria bacterium]